MVKISSMKQFYIKIILISSLLIYSLQQQLTCTLGQNCPLNQGMCVGDFCKCLDGFYSLLDPKLLPDQQIFCNYEQINVYKPLIMEIFLPSIGHFYVGKYWLGLLKLILLITYISCSYLIYGYLGVPRFIISIMKKFGISLKNFLPDGLIGDSDEEKEEKETKTGGDKEEKEEGEEKDNNENKEDIEDENEETIKPKNPFSKSIVPIKELFRATATNNEKSRGKSTQVKQVHNLDGNDIFNPEIEEALIQKEDLENEEEEENKEEEKEEIDPILEYIFNISTAFWVLYLLDLFFYKFKIYNDGNDVPFVE